MRFAACTSSFNVILFALGVSRVIFRKREIYYCDLARVVESGGMMRGRRLVGILRLLCAGVPLFGALVAQGATKYSVTNLGFLTGGVGTSEAVGINNFGQVVGTSDFTNGTETFLWTPTVANGKVGSMVNLGALSGGSGFSQPSGINDFGQVSGYTLGTSGQDLGTIWTPTSAHGTTGSLHALPTLAGEDFIQT
jgi:probable HAF family extracellular repeat protein